MYLLASCRIVKRYARFDAVTLILYLPHREALFIVYAPQRDLLVCLLHRVCLLCLHRGYVLHRVCLLHKVF